MKRILLLVLLATSLGAYGQQTLTTFILTRHAEKGNDGTKDPDLAAAGNERAQLLARMLTETKVDAVYSTNYKRTRNTVTPLAQAKGLTVVGYESFKGDEVDQMISKHFGGTIVIAGHSNDIPWIVNYLTGKKEEYKTFDDTDYNNLIIVTVVEVGKTAKITWLNY